MKYHIHIYKVIEKREVDLDAESKDDAKLKALLLPNNRTKKDVLDCKKIAIAFEA